MNTAIEVAESVRTGERRAVEVLETCLAEIERLNPELNAFVHLDAAAARRDAERIDALVKAGTDPGRLAGVPFGVKDLEDCAGMPTSYGSLLFKGSPPAVSDSVHVARLRSAGAVPLGKTAVPEFGAVALTDTRAWGTTRNPWNRAHTPGGSSGGSAAAVAAGMVPMCTAADGGGSIRIPAAFSGLVGFKPSFGRIPHPGNQPSATDVFGALVTTVADAARHLDVATGPHDCDRFTLPSPDISFERAIETVATEGLKAVWSVDLGFAVVDPEVASLAENAGAALIEAASLERVDRRVEFTDPVRLWQSNGVLDLYMGLQPGMWPERGGDLMDYISIPLSRADQAKPAQIASIWKRRQILDNELAALFADIDILITPTTAVPAFAAEWPMPSVINGTQVHPAMSVPFTMLANLGWQPAVSLPAGTTEKGLPVGLQVMCRRHADDLVLRLARIFEQARPWSRLAPV